MRRTASSARINLAYIVKLKKNELCCGYEQKVRHGVISGIRTTTQTSGAVLRGGQTIPGGDARELKASRQSVSRWYAEWKRGGAAALRGAVCGTETAAPAKQWEQLDQTLREGARTHGFHRFMDAARVAKVIERLTGVHYHPGHVWKILKAMRWTYSGRPPKRESAIRRR